MSSDEEEDGDYREVDDEERREEDLDPESDFEETIPPTDEESDEESGDDREAYDRELTDRHLYMGDTTRLSGRTFLDDDNSHDIGVIVERGFVLMPEQIVPLSFSDQVIVTWIKSLINTTKTFGIVYAVGRGKLFGIGTTAEIFEYAETGPSFIRLKARGSRRFRILSLAPNVHGPYRMAKVELLPEGKLGPIFGDARLQSRDRLNTFPVMKIETEENGNEPSETNFRDFCRKKLSICVSRNENEYDEDKRIENERLLTCDNPWRSHASRPAIGIWPNWVYAMYDEKLLVQRIHQCLRSLRLFSQTQINIPLESELLSYWLASNLPFDVGLKLEILKMNSALQRLIFELKIIENSQSLTCKSCDTSIAKKEDIFSMSKEGPQGTFVNSGGFVHETLTVYKVKYLTCRGTSSNVDSWFPGYAWTILYCSICGYHIGWKFTAEDKKLRPKLFYGISARSIRLKLSINEAESGQREEGGVLEYYRDASVY